MAGTAQTEWRENWGLVLAAMIGIAIAGVHYHVVGALVRPLEEAYGWSRSEVTLALTVSSVLSPFTNVLVGWLADRFGPRIVILCGVPLFGLSFALLGFTGFAVSAWLIGYGLFAVLGHGNSPVVWTMAVVRKFTASRGLALAVSLSGAGLLVSIIPGIVYSLVDSVGIQGTFFVLGAASILLVLPPALIFLPKAAPGTSGTGRAAHLAHAASADLLPGYTVGQTLSGTRFWRLAIAFLVVSTSVGTFIVHFQPMLTGAGMSRGEAARIALFLGPAMIFGRICTGLLFDKFEARLVATIAFLLPAVACTLLLSLTDDPRYAIFTAIIIGLGMGAEVDVLAYLTSRYFGLKRYGVIFGILIGLYAVGVGLGSALGGYVFDVTGGYDSLLTVLAILVVLAALNIALLGRPPALEAGASHQTLPAGD